MSRQIVITGVTQGLGRAVCRAFVAQGHHVVGCGRNSTALEELRREHPGQHFDVVDVTDDAQVEAWVSGATARGFAPDLLLNNAGLCHAPQPVWTMPAAEFDRVTRVNLGGVANVLRHWVPPMLEAGRGVIVNFSSGWGRSVAGGMGAYCMTKWGVEGLTAAVAEDLPRGLAAVALNPGIIHTFMLEQCFGGSASSYESPEEWAERAAPYLLGLESRHNGQALTVP